MRYIILFSLLSLMSSPSFGQENNWLFGGEQINVQILFLNPYYEFGADRINHFGFGGGVNVYKQFFVGAYKQWGSWPSPQEGSDFESKYSHGGFWIGHINRIKKSNYSILISCQLGKGESVSKQNTPIIFTDAQIRFNVITPEVGIEYRFMNFTAIMLSTGYHSYSKIDEDDQPIGFGGFDLNKYYTKLSFRIGRLGN